MQKDKNRKEKSANKTAAKGLIRDILICLAIVLVLTSIVKPTIVRGESMEGTLHDGNYLFVSKLAYTFDKPAPGDVIVFRCDFDGKELLIKRVIATEGQTVRTDGKTLYIDGKKVSEPYINPYTEGDQAMQEWTVPKDCLFVMGDNRDHSADSRLEEIGCVKISDIIGMAVFRALPVSEFGSVE